MLDSLGSTLTRSTVSSFFTRFGKQPCHDNITIDQAIQCLETELGRPSSEKKRLDADDALLDSSVATTLLSLSHNEGQEPKLDALDFSGSSMTHDEVGYKTNTHLTEPTQQPLRGTIPENSDSWSDDAEGDFSSRPPSPSHTSSQNIS